MRTYKTEYNITRYGDGYVVTIKDCCQRVFASTKECEQFVGSMLMSALTCGDDDEFQVSGSWSTEVRTYDETIPVKPEYHEE